MYLGLKLAANARQFTTDQSNEAKFINALSARLSEFCADFRPLRLSYRSYISTATDRKR